MKPRPTECPDPELLAAYLAGRVSPSERTAVTEHLADCADCYSVFIESVRTQSSARWAWAERIWRAIVEASGWSKAVVATAGLGAAAAGLTLFVQPQLVTRWWSGPEVAGLVAAVGTERTIEPRLTGGFAYGPLVEASVTRSGERGDDRLSPDLRIAALSLEKRLQGHREPSTLAAYAAGQLLTGQVDRAVSAFEQAARLAPKNARVQNDLSAAYLVRFKQKQDLEDVSKAVAAATAATEIDPSSAEGRFNLALALEALSLRNEARKAWEAYLKVDSRSPWAQEAKRHLDALAPEKQSERFEEEHRRVVDAAARGDRAEVLDAVTRLPDTAYDYVENELLPAWADAWLARDREKAADLIRRGRVVGEALSASIGERLPVDAVAAIEQATAGGGSRGNALARGHQLFRSARLAWAQRTNAGGGFGFREAQEPLAEGGSPLTAWVTFYLSAADYFRGDLTAASSSLDSLTEAADQHGYWKLQGRTLRLRGLLRGVRGNLANSLDDYQHALSIFARILDREELAGIHNLIAERMESFGENNAARMHYREGLAGLDAIRSTGSRRTSLLIAAFAAQRMGLLIAASAMQNELLDEAESVPPLEMAQMYLSRATVYSLLGRDKLAQDDVSSAARWAAHVSDRVLAERTRAEVELATGEVMQYKAPALARRSLDSSLNYFERAGLSQRLPQIYLAQGRAALADNRPQDAEISFLRGMGILESQRALLPSGELRLGYFDLPWNIFDEMIELLSAQPARLREALMLAERVRARDLLETATASDSNAIDDPAALSSRISSHTAMIYYVCLRDRLLTWVIRPGQVDLVQSRVSSSDLATDARAFQRAILEADQTEFDRLSGRLFTALVEPLRSDIRVGDTLVLVPDASLHTVPFAALKNPRTGRYVIEDHAVTVAPSATMFARASERLRRLSRGANRVFVVANPQVDAGDAGDLRILSGAEDEAQWIAGAYPDTVVLTGSRASKAEFMKAAGSFDIVHFGGHAIANDTYPLLSRLLFARDQGRSGILFAHELLEMQFDRTSLMVLAACRTAVGPLRKGEGAISLARPFLARGVPAVLATLWDVDDRASEILFKAFYMNLRSGSQPVEALREAQLHLLRNADARWHKPAAWAGFITTGGINDEVQAAHSNGGRQ